MGKPRVLFGRGVNVNRTKQEDLSWRPRRQCLCYGLPASNGCDLTLTQSDVLRGILVQIGVLLRGDALRANAIKAANAAEQMECRRKATLVAKLPTFRNSPSWIGIVFRIFS